jgi:hypothetical protein
MVMGGLFTTSWLVCNLQLGRASHFLGHLSRGPLTASAAQWHLKEQTTGELLTPFPNPTGLIFIPEPKICFISGHYLIETKLELDIWSLKANSVIEQLKKYIQPTFQNALIDFSNSRRKRSNSPRASKSTKPQSITIASMHKYLLYLGETAIPQVFDGFRGLFQKAKTTFTPFPFSPYAVSRGQGYQGTLPFLNREIRKGYVAIADALDPVIWNNHLQAAKRLNEPGNTLDLADGRVSFLEDTDPVQNQLIQLEHTVDVIQEFLDQGLAALNDLQEGAMPLMLYDYDQLSEILNSIIQAQPFPVFTTREMMEYLRTHIHTFVTRDNCSDTMPSPTCGMYVITYVPILSSQQAYDPYKITLLPVIKPGIIRDDWVKIKTPETDILVNEYSAKLYDPKNLWCSMGKQRVCRLCVSKLRDRQIPSRCFLNLLQSKDLSLTLRECNYEKLANVGDKAIILDERTIAYTNPQPGTLVERCPDQPPNNQQLMTGGMIHLNPLCQYEMFNGPLTSDDAYLAALIVTNPVENPSLDIQEVNEPEIIRHHLQEYAIPYLITLSSLLSLSGSTILLYCCCKRKILFCLNCCKRVRLRGQPRARNIPIATAPLATRPLQLTTRDDPYREARNHLNQLVRQHLATTAI